MAVILLSLIALIVNNTICLFAFLHSHSELITLFTELPV